MFQDSAKKQLYKYHLPDKDGKKNEYTTETNSVIIIGANGSGKSKLGAWIEQNDMQNVHRIGAQRNLSFNENIPLRSYTSAERRVFYGSEDRNDKGIRWNWGRLTTNLLNDFEDVLAALIALQNNEESRYFGQCKESESNGLDKPPVPITAIDK